MFLDDLTIWMADVVDALGYVGVALLVMVENLFPPIPSEFVLGLAGFAASQGDATVPGMIVAATVGSVVGAWTLYGCAAWFGPVRLRRMVVRYGRWTRVTEGDLDRAEGWFDRWSTLAVLVCRCVPVVRSLISIPAGLRRMPIVPFTIYTTVGSLTWNSIFVVAGYLLGEQWELVVQYADYLEYLVLAVIFVGMLVLARHWLARGRQPSAVSSAARQEEGDRR
ncbi:MAG: DedA family protein [Dehalococcoidia bacterium]|nr:DedA family protein [Dehalococcoidia bacterium]